MGGLQRRVRFLQQGPVLREERYQQTGRRSSAKKPLPIAGLLATQWSKPRWSNRKLECTGEHCDARFGKIKTFHSIFCANSQPDSATMSGSFKLNSLHP